MTNFVRVAATADLEPGKCKVVVADGLQIALFNVGGSFYALDNTCVHQGGPLGEGSLEGATVTCPWHAWSYDIKSGVCTANPNISVKTFPVVVEGADVKVGLS